MPTLATMSLGAHMQGAQIAPALEPRSRAKRGKGTVLIQDHDSQDIVHVRDVQRV